MCEKIIESMGDFSHDRHAAMLTSVKPDFMIPVYKVEEQFGEGLLRPCR